MSSIVHFNEKELKRLSASVEVRSRTTVPAKVAILRNHHRIPVHALAQHFQISETSVYKYSKLDGIVQERSGRPSLLTKAESEQVLAAVGQQSAAGVSPTTAETREIVLD